jgi:hypothetical protein
MEETKDTIVIRKKDIIRFALYSLSGLVVTIGGIVEFGMVLTWGSAHNATAAGTPVLYGILYLMIISFAAITVFLGIALLDLGQVKFKLATLEETLIKEIREGRNLDENHP